MSDNLDTLKNLVQKQKDVVVVKISSVKGGILDNWSISVLLEEQFLTPNLVKLCIRGNTIRDNKSRLVCDMGLLSLDIKDKKAITTEGTYELGDIDPKFIEQLQGNSMVNLERVIDELS